jgi:hypothetical protein
MKAHRAKAISLGLDPSLFANYSDDEADTMVDLSTENISAHSEMTINIHEEEQKMWAELGMGKGGKSQVPAKSSQPTPKSKAPLPPQTKQNPVETLNLDLNDDEPEVELTEEDMNDPSLLADLK